MISPPFCFVAGLALLALPSVRPPPSTTAGRTEAAQTIPTDRPSVLT